MLARKAGHEILTRGESQSELQWIEQIARTCYKSEEYITEDGTSAEKLVTNLVNRKHYAMLEHASIILKMDYELYTHIKHLASLIDELDCMTHTYLKFSAYDGRYIVSGNMRAWLDFLTACESGAAPVPHAVLYTLGGGSSPELKHSRQIIFGNLLKFEGPVRSASYCEEIQPYHLLRCAEMLVHFPVTVKWTCDRGVTHEIVRHRDASYAQESTRYCNYNKEKYGSQVTFINLSRGMELDAAVAKLPEGIKEEIYTIWFNAMEYAETAYMEMIKLGATPQIARSVLPNSVKTELIMTATLDEWTKFFTLRLPAAAHPQMREVAQGCFDELHSMYPEIFLD